jgi:death-on-curing protein
MAEYTYVWPNLEALLDDFALYFRDIGQDLQVVSVDDLEAGMDGARNAWNYLPEADAATLAALIFDGVVTRYALLDGNKRLAWQAMSTFLDMNEIWFDAPELDSAQVALSVVEGTATVDTLAQFIRQHTSSWNSDVNGA